MLPYRFTSPVCRRKLCDGGSSCSDPAFQAGVRSRNELQAVVGITRNEGSQLAAGWVSWIAVGGH
ncbi:WIAG-tail domain [Paenibacillus vortex]|uniref:WIAG-tail domain n=1 Tax=Paenibacillus vortex TaxID=71995 RepID=UPI001F1C0E0E|nr:WIAG-tail domain [Paenibacillus vortex]